MARGVVVASVVLGACSATEVADPSDSTTAPTSEAEAVKWTCPAGSPAGARCSRVEVPADWSEPGGPTVSLPVVVVPATGLEPRPDPLVVPAGGPGGSSTGVAAQWSDPHRDIVLYDQRGTGAAEPSLACPERNDAWIANLQRDAPFDEERAAIVAAFDACRDRLEAGGVDLDDYDTEANVRDLDAIRTALGYDEWNILGVSYGARLALAAMRSTPQGIRSVVLDSVYDVTSGGLAATQASGERAFAELARACGHDASCGAAHPDLAAEIDAVERRYSSAPVHVDVDLDDGHGPQTFVITGADMVAGLFQAMYDPQLLALLPSIIGNLADGDTSIIGELVRRNVATQDETAWGMNLAVNCADNAGLDADSDTDTDAAAVADPGRFRLLIAVPLCSEWPVEATSGTFNDPVHSDIPALVVAGRFDPITPPGGSRAVADRLEDGTFALWPNRGHGVTGDPCADTVMSAFLDHPTATVDLACVQALPGPRFG